MQRLPITQVRPATRPHGGVTPGMDWPGHRFYRRYCDLLQQVTALPDLPGVLGEQDLARVAAQLVLETWLSGIEQVDGIGLRRGQVLQAWADDGPQAGRHAVRLSLRQALAYSVGETTRALEEALQAWPLDAAQRRRLHALPPSW